MKVRIVILFLFVAAIPLLIMLAVFNFVGAGLLPSGVPGGNTGNGILFLLVAILDYCTVKLLTGSIKSI